MSQNKLPNNLEKKYVKKVIEELRSQWIDYFIDDSGSIPSEEWVTVELLLSLHKSSERLNKLTWVLIFLTGILSVFTLLLVIKTV